MPRKLSVAKDYTRYPAGRYRSDGPWSGEGFREDVLIPALNEGDVVLVLDDVAGLPSSFLEEITGGLVRRGFSGSDLTKRLTIVAETPRMQRYPEQAWRYVSEADAHVQKQAV